mmetsp:Transcript_77568/g.141059  ORF Transcript_77568/g.141059 Transcript_77568/m.141059 type:complete len:678 (+) Transcript_77568:80-2113(+)
MWLICSPEGKAPAEKLAKNGQKKDSEDAACDNFMCCMPETAVGPAGGATRISRPTWKRQTRTLSNPSEASTHAPTEASTVSHATSQHGSKPKKVNQVRLEKNLKKMRIRVREVVGQLNHFQVWMKKKFKTPEDCFDALAGDSRTKQLELEGFVYNAKIQGFKGQADKVFHGLCDEESWSAGWVITKDAFVKRMTTMGTPLVLAVRQAMTVNHKKIQKNVAKKKKEDLQKGYVDQLIFFRNFIEPIFDSPKKVFDDIAGDDGCIDEDEFVTWLSGHDFPGDAKKVFHCFCDEDGLVDRDGFSSMLATCKSLATPPQDKASTKDDEVKEKNNETTKAKTASELSKERQLEKLAAATKLAKQALNAQAKPVAGKKNSAAAKGLKNRRQSNSVEDDQDDVQMSTKSAPQDATDGRKGSKTTNATDSDQDVASDSGEATRALDDEAPYGSTSGPVTEENDRKPSKTQSEGSRKPSKSAASMDSGQDDAPGSEKATQARNDETQNASTSGNNEAPSKTPTGAKGLRRGSKSMTSVDAVQDDALTAGKPKGSTNSTLSKGKGKGRRRSSDVTAMQDNQDDVQTSTKGASQAAKGKRRGSKSTTSMDAGQDDALNSGDSKAKGKGRRRSCDVTAMQGDRDDGRTSSKSAPPAAEAKAKAKAKAARRSKSMNVETKDKLHQKFMTS